MAADDETSRVDRELGRLSLIFVLSNSGGALLLRVMWSLKVPHRWLWLAVFVSVDAAVFAFCVARTAKLRNMSISELIGHTNEAARADLSARLRRLRRR